MEAVIQPTEEELSSRYRTGVSNTFGCFFLKSVLARAGLKTKDNLATKALSATGTVLGMFPGFGGAADAGCQVLGGIARIAQDDMEEGIADELLAIAPNPSNGVAWASFVKNFERVMAKSRSEDFRDIASGAKTTESDTFHKVADFFTETLPEKLKELNPLRKSPVHILSDKDLAATSMAIEDTKQAIKMIERGELRQFIDPKKQELGIVENPQALKKATNYLVSKIIGKEIPSPDAEKPLAATQVAPKTMQHESAAAA